MEPLELLTAVGSALSGYDGLSWRDRAYVGDSLDPDLLEWCSILDTATGATAAPAEVHNNTTSYEGPSLDQLLASSHETGSNRSSLTEDAFLPCLLEPSLLAPEAEFEEACLFADMAICPPDGPDGSASMHTPSQALASSAQDSLWGFVRDALEVRMSDLHHTPHPVYDQSPACSTYQSGHVSTGCESIATADHACSSQLKSCGGSEESCTRLTRNFAAPGLSAAHKPPEAESAPRPLQRAAEPGPAGREAAGRPQPASGLAAAAAGRPARMHRRAPRR